MICQLKARVMQGTQCSFRMTDWSGAKENGKWQVINKVDPVCIEDNSNPSHFREIPKTIMHPWFPRDLLGTTSWPVNHQASREKGAHRPVRSGPFAHLNQQVKPLKENPRPKGASERNLHIKTSGKIYNLLTMDRCPAVLRQTCNGFLAEAKIINSVSLIESWRF